MTRRLRSLLPAGLLLATVACRSAAAPDDNEPPPPDPDPPAAGRLVPGDLRYLGAFRLPAGGASDVDSFRWGGMSLAYRPDGDPSGPADGTPGSLFVTGHEWQHRVAEVTIPAPRLSAGRELAELACATMLQPFRDILQLGGLEIPRAGILYLPPAGDAGGDRLHVCWGYHMQLEGDDETHGWCKPTLAQAETRRGWHLGDLPAYRRRLSTNQYLFEIPAEWAGRYAHGRRLASGRFRDGGWSGRGPALFAIAPWQHGDPPPPGTAIGHTPLLLYSSTLDEPDEGHALAGYHHSDEWTGGAWLQAGDKAAVVFAGTKGTGDCWYGDPAGPCLDCENRGWWSTGFVGMLLFFDPADLAAVAQGAAPPWQPQPYASLAVDAPLFHVVSGQQKRHLGGLAYDRARNILYIAEFMADGDQPLVHAWRVGAE